MILLDTNYLIMALVSGSPEAGQISQWLTSNEQLCTSSIAWYEFCCGPVDDQAINLILCLMDEQIVPFTSRQAGEAARLYNATGRKRHLRVDAMLAAAAITCNASLATANERDFRLFQPFGLKLV